MQQEHVLTELFHYVSQSPPPFDTLWKLVINSLREGFFPMTESQVNIVKCYIDIGMSFFNKWLDCLKKVMLLF